jgi:hypothetical protein
MVGGPFDPGGQMWGNSEVQMLRHKAFYAAKNSNESNPNLCPRRVFGDSILANKFLGKNMCPTKKCIIQSFWSGSPLTPHCFFGERDPRIRRAIPLALANNIKTYCAAMLYYSSPRAIPYQEEKNATRPTLLESEGCYSSCPLEREEKKNNN